METNLEQEKSTTKKYGNIILRCGYLTIVMNVIGILNSFRKMIIPRKHRAHPGFGLEDREIFGSGNIAVLAVLDMGRKLVEMA